MKRKPINQGSDYPFGGGSIYVLLKTKIDLTGYTAEVKIDGTDWLKDFSVIPADKKLPITITKEESAAMSLGYHESSVKLTAPDGTVKTVRGDTIFEVRRPQDGDN